MVVACFMKSMGVIKGEATRIEELVNSIASSRTYTPDIVIACRHGNIQKLERLLQAGVNVNVADNEGRTPLITACDNNNPFLPISGNSEAIVRILLKKGAYVNVADNTGRTPLIAACHSGQKIQDTEIIVRMLIEAGADVNAVDNSGQTALRNTESPKIKQLIIAKMIEDLYQEQAPELSGIDLKEFAKLAAALVTPNQIERISDENEISAEIFEDVITRTNGVLNKNYIIPNCEDASVSHAVILSPQYSIKFLNSCVGVGQYFSDVKKALGFDVLDSDFQQTLSFLYDLPDKMKGPGEVKIFPTELMNEIMQFGFGPLYNYEHPQVFEGLTAFLRLERYYSMTEEMHPSRLLRFAPKFTKVHEIIIKKYGPHKTIKTSDPYKTCELFLANCIAPEEGGAKVEEIPVDEDVPPAGESSDQTGN